jgi:hypothetical protein
MNVHHSLFTGGRLVLTLAAPRLRLTTSQFLLWCSLVVAGVAQNITGWQVVKPFYHINTKFLQLQRFYWFKVPTAQCSYP